MKRALITGITGQDGAYLARFLLNKGYEVYGLMRRTSSPNFWRLQELNVLDKVKLIPGDMTDKSSILRAVSISNPDEIYNLAAQSFVGSSFDQPITTQQVDGVGCLHILEVVRHINKKIRVYQASTSELYGTVAESPQTEKTVFSPNSPYANAKLYAFHTARIYREAYGIFVSNGILFNHESPLRGLEFVTRKITNAAVKIKLGLEKEIHLGNLDASRDWGHAEEYVEAMWKILQMDKADDFVIATGETHSVEEFAKEAFASVGLDWKNYVKSKQSLKRPHDVHFLRGDNSKAKAVLGWEPKIKFKELVKLMVEADMNRWQRYLKGEIFAWDAPNHPVNINIISDESHSVFKNFENANEKTNDKIKEISKCRVCGNENLVSLINLGEYSLSGRFPGKDEEDPMKGPLHLVKCDDSENKDACGLVQLKHSVDANEMYGETYGYRSGLNKSMVAHLTKMALVIENLVELLPGDAVLDIGSSDAVLLKAYQRRGLEKLGIDPAAEKFRSYYTDGIRLVSDFFSAEKYLKVMKDKKAKAVTSIAMFYDLEDPISFAKEVKKVLHPKGIWVLEQSYMPKMLEVNAFDTICQEHLEYYSLKQVEWIAKKAGFKVFDIEFNETNGGSFRCYLCHEENSRPVNEEEIQKIRSKEIEMGFNTLKPYKEFKERVLKIKDELNKFLLNQKNAGKKIHVLGASTKGNVLLQFLGIDNKLVDMASDVNKDKWGKVTPETRIPIVSEEHSRAQNPDFYLALPWHFRDGLIEREKDFLSKGGQLIFPLPNPEVIGASNASNTSDSVH